MDIITALPAFQNFDLNDFLKINGRDLDQVPEQMWSHLLTKFHFVPTDEILRLTIKRNLNELILAFLANPETNITFDHYAIVKYAADSLDPRMRQLVARHPKFDW